MLSPDGNLLAFSSNRTGEYNIFVYDYSTDTPQQLTQSPDNDRYPSFSRNNKQLLFNSDRTGKGDIYETAADGGSGFAQLTDSEKLEEYACYDPKNENGLLFSRRIKRGFPHPKMEIVYMDRSAGSRAVRVLSKGDQARYSPDGKRIVFVSRRTKNADIWLMSAEGGLQTQLVSDPKEDRDPCFSPDGKQIVFASNRTGNYDIWAMNSDGTNQRQLTWDAADETQPCWSAGGYLYYTREISSTKSNIFRISAPK